MQYELSSDPAAILHQKPRVYFQTRKKVLKQKKEKKKKEIKIESQGSLSLSIKIEDADQIHFHTWTDSIKEFKKILVGI